MQVLSNTYDGRYLKLTVTQTAVDHENAISTFSWVLSSEGGNNNYYDIAETTVIIAGCEVYSKSATSKLLLTFPAAKGTKSGSFSTNPGNGKKTIIITLKTNIGSLSSPQSYTAEMPITPVNTSAPTITLVCSDITDKSVKLTITTSDECDTLDWQYRQVASDDNYNPNLNAWTSFQGVSETTDKIAECTITGLAENQTYEFRVLGRNKLNLKTNVSSVVSVNTYYATTLQECSAFIDSGEYDFKLYPKVANENFIHDLKIKYKNLEFSFSNLQLTNNVRYNSFTLSAEQCLSVLSVMTDKKSDYATMELTTYLDANKNTQIGKTQTANFLFKTSAENSSPIFTGFSYADISALSIALTSDNQVLIQDISELYITCQTAIARNSATILSYSAVAGNTAKTSVESEFSLGVVSVSGTVPIVITAIDSRGYTATATVNVTVIPYKKIEISSIEMRRINNIESYTSVEVSCDITPVIVNGEDKNLLKQFLYRYRKTSDSTWSSYYNMTDYVVRNGNKLTFNIDEWSSTEDSAPVLDTEFSYYIQFVFNDQLTQDREDVTISKSIPLMSFRKDGVGVNNPDPKSSFDVIGEIMMNGFNVVGFVSDLLASDHLDQIINSGVYRATNPTDNGYPSEANGTLLVIRAGSYVTQFFWRYKDTSQFYFRRGLVNSSNTVTFYGWRVITSTALTT